MDLPMSVVPGTDPPRFRWKQVVDSPNGKVVVDQEGMLPVSVERSVERLISIARQLLLDNAGLQGQVRRLTDRLGETEPENRSENKVDSKPDSKSIVVKQTTPPVAHTVPPRKNRGN